MNKFASIIGVFFLAAVLLTPIIHFSTFDTVTAVVTEKERVSDSSGNSIYLVWTENETFQVADSWLAMRFYASDDYGKIADGATCTFKVNWFRFGLTSSYRNILNADCS